MLRAALLPLGVCLVCLPQPGAALERVYPGETWERRTPAEAGFEPEALQAAMDYAAAVPELTDLNCASVHRDGYLVAEVYAEGRGPEDTTTIFSTSKPVVASLLGALQRDGALDVGQRASDYISEWVGTESAEVTIDQLLRHDSGRFFFDWYLDAEYSQSMPSQTAYALVLAQSHPPGTTYAYNQMAFQSLERVLTEAAGVSAPELTQRELWSPLQFESDTFWWAEGFEWPPGSGEPGPATDPILYGGMTTSCRDLARFCHLWLQRGEWAEGQRVFTDEFYEIGINPPDRGGSRYHWSSPPNYNAGGAFGQFCSFNPENGVVLTRLGGTDGPGPFSAGVFTELVMEALSATEDRGSYNATASKLELAARAAEEAALERKSAKAKGQAGQ